jgi:hypothetical protein
LDDGQQTCLHNKKQSRWTKSKMVRPYRWLLNVLSACSTQRCPERLVVFPKQNQPGNIATFGFGTKRDTDRTTNWKRTMAKPTWLKTNTLYYFGLSTGRGRERLAVVRSWHCKKHRNWHRSRVMNWHLTSTEKGCDSGLDNVAGWSEEDRPIACQDHPVGVIGRS